MILTWMLYAGGIALLLGLAARSLEETARGRAWPLRGLWAGALLGSFVIPALALLRELLRRETAPVAPSQAGAVELAGVTALANVATVLTSWMPSALIPDTWLLAAWAAASAICLLGLAASLWQLSRRSDSWTPRPLDGHRVWVSRDTGPAVVGALRSRIVVPEWVLERDHGELSLILTHEAEHVKARDPALMAAARLLLAVFPWNLPLWWQCRRLQYAVELDCDRRVLARGSDPRAYIRLLLDVSELGTAHRLAVVALSESPSLLERRIRAMLTPTQPRGRLLAAGSFLIAVLAVLVACNVDNPSVEAITATDAAESSASADEGTRFDSMSGGHFFEVGVLESPPELRNAAEVTRLLERLYPPELRNAGIGGTVLMQFVVQPDGAADPQTIEVLDAAHQQLVNASIRAVESMRFQPGIYNGRPVGVLLRMPISWQPKN